MIYNNKHIEVGDKIGPRGAIFIEEKGCDKYGHKKALFLCSQCLKNTFISSIDNILRNQSGYCEECAKENSKNKRTKHFVKGEPIIDGSRFLYIGEEEPYVRPSGRTDRIILVQDKFTLEYFSGRMTHFLHNRITLPPSLRIKKVRDRSIKYKVGDIIEINGYKILFKEEIPPLYYSNKTPIRSGRFVNLDVQKDFIATVQNVTSGKTLGVIKSKGETKIEHICNINHIYFISQATFDDCVNPFTSYKFRFDFYFPNYNCCIEYDGEQHFKPVEYWGGERGFEEQQYKDKLKNNYCLSHSIRLVRIPYTEYDNLTFPYIQDILDKKDNRFDVKGLINARL